MKYFQLKRQSLVSEPQTPRMAGKSSLKDKLEDGELDLSMMQYNDVPVKVTLPLYCLETCWTPLLCRR